MLCMAVALRSPAADSVSTIDPHAALQTRYGDIPLHFEANRGQAADDVAYLCRGPGYAVYLTETEALFVLRANRARSSDGANDPSVTAPERLRLRLAGANADPTISGADELPGKSNYFTGHDPSRWRTNVPTFAKVVYTAVYPGIDLVYYGNQRQLEHDFVLAPGADPGLIRFEVDGAESLDLDADGNLSLCMPGGEAVLRAPVAYQEIGGRRQLIVSRYVLDGGEKTEKRLTTEGTENTEEESKRQKVEGEEQEFAMQRMPATKDTDGDESKNQKSEIQNQKSFSSSISFALGPYDPAYPLVIDPVLVYSTYLGGSGDDVGVGIAVDDAGNAYVVGNTGSTSFPCEIAANCTRLGSGGGSFVVKFNPSGSALVYSTYLANAGALAIAIDDAGNAYITGTTRSDDFPTTAGAFQTSKASGFDNGFVTKISADGATLMYSTFLSGSMAGIGSAGTTACFGIAVDSTGHAYVTGQTNAYDFPTTPGALQPVRSGADDAFITKLNPTGSALVYSTFFGGDGSETGYGIVVDGGGHAYIAGETDGSGLLDGSDFPVTIGAFDPLRGTNVFGRSTDKDGFISKLSPDGSALIYSTYVGGGNIDACMDIDIDPFGNAYVTGQTKSADLPTTGPLATPKDFVGTTGDAFAIKVTADGAALVYGTFLQRPGFAYGASIAADDAGNAYVTGFSDAWVVKIDPEGLEIVEDTTLSTAIYQGRAIAADAQGNAYVTGEVLDGSMPTKDPLQGSLNGNSDAFVTKVAMAPTRFALSAFFPLQTGNAWTYRQDGSETVTRTIAGATVEVNGTPTTLIQDAAGFNAYFTHDENGLRLHRQDRPDGTTMVFTPPITYFQPHAVVGNSIAGNGTAAYSPAGGGTFTLDYSAMTTVNATDIVTVPQDRYFSVKLTVTAAITGSISGQPFTQNWTDIYWLARSIGPVRHQRTIAGATNLLELALSLPDRTAPEMTITPLTTELVYKTGDERLNLSGMAADNVDVHQVSWFNHLGDGGIANGTTSWYVDDIVLVNRLNVITVVAEDAAGNAQADTIYVHYNAPPVLLPIGNLSVYAGEKLSLVVATWFDGTYPVDQMTYSLVAGPNGAAINAETGEFNWSPSVEQGIGTYTATIRVTDDGVPSQTDSESVTLTVLDPVTLPPAVTPFKYWGPNNAVVVATGGSRPTAVPDGAGGAIFLWEASREDVHGDIYGQRLDADGNRLWGEHGIPLITATDVNGDGVDQGQVVGATDGAGGAIFAWRDSRNGQREIYAQRVDPDGNPLWGEQGIPIAASCWPGGSCGNTHWHAQIVADGEGGAIITWDEMADGFHFSVWAQRVNAAGQVLWAVDGVPLVYGPFHAYFPRIVSDGEQGAIVAWQDHRFVVPTVYFAQRLDATGTPHWPIGGVRIFSANASVGTEGYDMIEDGAGGAILAWVDGRNENGTNNADIYAQRIGASGDLLWSPDGVPACRRPRHQYTPILATTGDGGAIVAWEDHGTGAPGSGAAQWMYQRFSAAGEPLLVTNGVQVFTEHGFSPDIVEYGGVIIGMSLGSSGAISDGAGGVIGFSVFNSNSPPNFFAQRISDRFVPTVVTITAPSVSPSYSSANSVVNLAGTIAATLTVNSVSWTNSRGGSGVAAGTTTWTANGIGLQPGVNLITVTAQGAAQNYSDTLTVIYNTRPILATIPNQTVIAEQLLMFTVTATDADSPANRLSFSLDNPSLFLGATIDPDSGLVHWRPAPSHGTHTYTLTVVVTDDSTPALSASQTVEVTVHPLAVEGWQLRPLTGVTNDLKDVGYGNGLFVAVGADGTILTSPDGAGWNSRVSGSMETLESITYGEGLFVVVGSYRTILTSPDGTLWTDRSVEAVHSLYGVAYGNGMFGAVNGELHPNRGIVTSADGVTWTIGNKMFFGRMRDIAYGNGLFMLVGLDGERMTSADLSSYSDRGDPTREDYHAVTFCRSSFLVVGTNGTAFTSSAGLESGARSQNYTNASSEHLYGAGYGNGQFIAVGDNGVAMSSVDGKNWTAGDTGVSTRLEGVAWGDGSFVVVGAQGTIIQSSPLPPPNPLLNHIPGKTAFEGMELSFFVTPVSETVAGQTVRYSLGAGAPSGTTIDAITGEFRWTPTAAQAPAAYDVVVEIANDAAPPQSDSREFRVSVYELNERPTLHHLADRTVAEGNDLVFMATATDDDTGDALNFSLGPGAPTGAWIDTDTGEFHWTPIEAQGHAAYSITVIVTDDGAPNLSDSQLLLLSVTEVNTAPTLAEIADQVVIETVELRFFAAATDADLPHDVLSYSLDSGAPTGASIDPVTGEFRWTPTAAQGPGQYSVTIRVTDNGNPVLSDTHAFIVTVTGVPPVNFDIDGNGALDALTDGLLIFRYLHGLRGAPLTDHAVASNCTRCTTAEIRAFLDFLNSAGSF